jgi:UPF0755 protein
LGKKKAYKRYIYYLSIILLSIALIILLTIHYFLDYIKSPISDSHDTVTIEIKAGDSTESIINKLVNCGLVKRPNYFKLFIFLSKKKIKAAEYEFNTSISPRKLLDILSSGISKLYKVVIPEGFTIDQIAYRFESLGITKKETFIAMTEDFLQTRYTYIPQKLEGYLYPETYYFPKNMDPSLVINTMLRNFNSVISEYRLDIENSGFTLHQIITIASIIEKETPTNEEKPIISAVIQNRLKIDMLLQCDPTIIYALGKNYDGDIRTKDKFIDSPYNTYLYKGLPPGPICNPGKIAIYSAIHPVDVDYLYFVSKNDGSHYFSKTLKEHNYAVRKYQHTK